MKTLAYVTCVCALLALLSASLATAAPLANCQGAPVTIVGTAGNDVLNGTPGADVIAGLEGDDFIYGLDGNDRLCGGPGNDFLSGGNGNDRLHGGPGDDALDGGAGNDTAYYNNSPAGVAVHLAGGFSPDGFGANDVLDNVENLVGSAFADLLEGNDAVNKIYGQDGDDAVRGFKANDSLDGQNGFDTIDGGAGAADVCLGEVLLNCP